MQDISTLQEMKEIIQAGFDKNEESLERFGLTYSTQLKAYLIESNNPPDISGCPAGEWKKIDSNNYYTNKNDQFSNTMFLDTTRKRVWILYSIMDAQSSDFFVDEWIKKTKGLDQCWFSRNQLLHWEKIKSWKTRGMGLRFSDGLTPEEEAGNFSLKAWHGAGKHLPEIEKILDTAKEQFAIYSIRWQKISNGQVSISAEWYSDGKVTINRASDVDEVIATIGEMANRYSDSLVNATTLKDKKMGAFEINCEQQIDLERFSKTVLIGRGEMKLWLIETESQPDFKRFKGIDLHTWDRVFLDAGPNFVYLTVPGKGCVNAAPRIATIQGEDNAGKTSIFFDGVDVFV